MATAMAAPHLAAHTPAPRPRLHTSPEASREASTTTRARQPLVTSSTSKAMATAETTTAATTTAPLPQAKVTTKVPGATEPKLATAAPAVLPADTAHPKAAMAVISSRVDTVVLLEEATVLLAGTRLRDSMATASLRKVTIRLPLDSMVSSQVLRSIRVAMDRADTVDMGSRVGMEGRRRNMVDSMEAVTGARRSLVGKKIEVRGR
jgi:hypothetical protein